MLAGMAVAAAATAIAVADSWRTASLALAATSAVFVVRARYSSIGALALLIVTAVVVVAGVARTHDLRAAGHRDAGLHGELNVRHSRQRHQYREPGPRPRRPRVTLMPVRGTAGKHAGA